MRFNYCILEFNTTAGNNNLCTCLSICLLASCSDFFLVLIVKFPCFSLELKAILELLEHLEKSELRLTAFDHLAFLGCVSHFRQHDELCLFFSAT